MSSFNINAFIIFAMLGVVSYIRPLQKVQPRVQDRQSGREYYILLSLIVLAAVAVRVYRFGAVPGGFNQDGAMAAVDAKALADYGTDRLGMSRPVHLTAWGFGQMSALMSYLMIPFIKLFSLSAVTARLPTLLVSLGGLACLYFFSKDAFGEKPALAILFIAAVNPWHIVQSRWALDCNLFPHFFLAGVFFLNRGVEREKHNIAISMLMFALSMYCYGIAIYTVPAFILAACIYLLAAKKIRLRHAFMALAVYLLFAWPFIAVMAINFFKLDTVETALFTLPYFPGSTRASDILLFSDDFWTQLLSNLKSLANVALLQREDLVWNEVRGFGTMYLFSLPLTAVGLAELIRGLKKNAGPGLVLIFLLTALFSGVMTNNVNINRLNLIFYPMIILCGLGLWHTMSFWGKIKALAPALLAAAFVLFSVNYFTGYADEISQQFFADFGAAVSSVKDEDVDKLYITADVQGEGRGYVSEILTLFYHRTDARYYRGETPEGETPFDEKYVFASMKDISIDPDEDAVYVVRESDLPFFDSAYFDSESFGSYYVLRAK